MKSENVYRGHVPFVRILAFFILGVICGYQLKPNLNAYLLLQVGLLITFSVFLLFHFLNKWIRFSLYAGFPFFLGIFFLGWILLWKSDPIINRSHFSHHKAQVLVGVVNTEPKFTDAYSRFELKVTAGYQDGNRVETTGLLLVNLKLDTINEDLKYGDVLMVPAYYYEVSPPYNPRDFNYKAFLINNNIWHSSFLEKDQFKRVDEKKGNSIVLYAVEFRQRMLQRFEEYLLDRSALSIASALVLGYRNDMDKEVVNVFTDTGTVHVLSVSGLHVGIVFVVFSALLFWMDRNPRIKFIKGLVLIVLIWFYALVTGFSPSVLRAAIMISFTLIAFHFVKDGNIYNTIAASAFMLLFYNPKFINNIGFQLSYLAVIAIIYLYPKLRDVFQIENRILSWLWNYSALSIAAQLITFPLVMFYFNNFPLYFLPANIFIIIPATFIVYLGFALLIVPHGFLASLIAQALEALILFSKRILESFAKLPFASMNELSINGWQLLLIYCLIGSVVFAVILKRKQLIYCSIGVIVTLASLRVHQHIYTKNKTQIRFYNVNRSLAIGIFNSGEPILFTDSLFTGSKNYQYLKGNIELEKGKVQIKTLVSSDRYSSNNVLIEGNIIQVNDKRVFIYDKILTSEGSLFVDILLIRNNMNETLESIYKNIKFKKLLIDGSNSDKHVKLYIEEAEKLSLPFYVLKNNFAYVW
ncbi:MAG TPA: ComEC/Rec2 family competence protein [Sphingobacteriaceae bacterium]|nr:ComEC/Rec2 family competence protein [Sphingobacteriaceae bacterium]